MRTITTAYFRSSLVTLGALALVGPIVGPLGGCSRSAGTHTPEVVPTGPIAIPATAAGTCPTVAPVLDDAVIHDTTHPTPEPTIVERLVATRDGWLQLAYRDVVERTADGRPRRQRTTWLAEGCAILEIDVVFDPRRDEPARRETRVFDEQAASMIFPYSPPPRNDVTVWTLDAAGRPVREERDDFIDGTIDFIVTHAYDAAGREVRRELILPQGSDAIAWPERPYVKEWVYDDAGTLERETYRSTVGEGETYEEITERRRDAAGRLLSQDMWVNGTLTEEDARTWDADGRPLTRARRYYNEWTRTAWTWRADGSSDVHILYTRGANVWREERETFNAEGLRVYFEQDQPHDGRVDWIEERTWAAGGAPLTWRARSIEAGVIEVQRDTQWLYDAAGRVTEERARAGWRPGTRRWTYRDGGREVRIDGYDDADRLARSHLTRYDDAGHETYVGHDDDADGEFETERRQAYDALGRWIRLESGRPGEINHSLERRYHGPVIWGELPPAG